MYKLYLLLAGFTAAYTSSGQEATNSASGSGQAGNIIIDWSLGEMTLVHTAQNGNLVFTQGLHQGRLAGFSSSTTTISNGELLITPNPTTGLLNVYIGFLQPGQLTLHFYDAQGKFLMEISENVTGFSTRSISLAAYPGGMYVAHAQFTPGSGDARKRTYKILKLQ
jgi:hypothetical protein